ncbi:Clp protease N-terminal domain-containing protein [Actinomadura rupiterrae]|uniref:Clp protease N-terminal domain-containing protein n=1 Tax=Actinomadura rupiterrae TaxID=559627 RepID=UPI0020A35E40|nr:Clp protease N-terminal domain-containing protein [Actinomadura rupiterrae]MCP2334714.1 ATP-dependent Clp protease ATP-binding subunit ClpA [Actinomadura rupiterrae]
MGRVYVDALLVRASEEARRAGARLTEAEHLLLALAGGPEGGEVRGLLDAAGLDHQGVQDALQREFEHGLKTAGVSGLDDEVLRPREAGRMPSDIGESGRRVMEQAMATARKKDLRAPHILLGILGLKVGTVPRALKLAEVDVDDLRTRTRALL